MARLAHLVVAGAVLANGVVAAVGWPALPADASVMGAPQVQNQRTPPDDEPLDADVGAPANTNEPLDAPIDAGGQTAAPSEQTTQPQSQQSAADEEPLDQGAPPAAAPAGGTDVEPLDQGAPPAAPPPASLPPAPAPPPAPAAAPAPAPAPAPAAAPAPAPSGGAQAPVATGPTFPFNGGGVFVNAGMGPDEAPSGQGVSTCSVWAVNGRAYSGSDCSGANVVVGFTPSVGSAATGVASTGASEIHDIATMTIPDFVPNLASSTPPPSSRSTPSGSAARNSNSTTVSETPGSVTNPNGAAIQVTGPSRTTTNTITRNKDGKTVTDNAQGANNQTKVPKSSKDNNGQTNSSKNGKNGGKNNKKHGKKHHKGKNHKNKKHNKKHKKNKKQSAQNERSLAGGLRSGERNLANTNRAREIADKWLPAGCRTDGRTRPGNPPGCAS